MIRHTRLTGALFWLLLLGEVLTGLTAAFDLFIGDWVNIIWALFLFTLCRGNRRLIHSTYHGKEVYFDPNILPPGCLGQDSHSG